jgi:transcriptional regulator with XRE-family HTH domain
LPSAYKLNSSYAPSMESPLQRERRLRGWTQSEVADRVGQLDAECGIDSNTVSRHERGIHIPRRPYPELYAKVFGVSVESLFPGYHDGMERRTFLRAVAATSAGLSLSPRGLADNSFEALTSITAGLRRLEATTPSADLWGPARAHLKLCSNAQKWAAAAEAARLAAWLAWDQGRSDARTFYSKAVGYAQRSRSEVLVAHMQGSQALWLAETGRGNEAIRLVRDQHNSTGFAHSWFSTMRATVASSVRDTDACIEALKSAEQHLTVATTTVGLDPFTYPKLQAYTGRAYVRLGLHKAAVPALQEALRDMPATKYKGVLLGELARSLDDDEALELRHEARELGERYKSKKVLSGC